MLQVDDRVVGGGRQARWPAHPQRRHARAAQCRAHRQQAFRSEGHENSPWLICRAAPHHAGDGRGHPRRDQLPEARPAQSQALLQRHIVLGQLGQRLLVVQLSLVAAACRHPAHRWWRRCRRAGGAPSGGRIPRAEARARPRSVHRIALLAVPGERGFGIGERVQYRLPIVRFGFIPCRIGLRDARAIASEIPGRPLQQRVRPGR